MIWCDFVHGRYVGDLVLRSVRLLSVTFYVPHRYLPVVATDRFVTYVLDAVTPVPLRLLLRDSRSCVLRILPLPPTRVDPLPHRAHTLHTTPAVTRSHYTVYYTHAPHLHTLRYTLAPPRYTTTALTTIFRYRSRYALPLFTTRVTLHRTLIGLFTFTSPLRSRLRSFRYTRYVFYLTSFPLCLYGYG